MDPPTPPDRGTPHTVLDTTGETVVPLESSFFLHNPSGVFVLFSHPHTHTHTHIHTPPLPTNISTSLILLTKCINTSDSSGSRKTDVQPPGSFDHYIKPGSDFRNLGQSGFWTLGSQPHPPRQHSRYQVSGLLVLEVIDYRPLLSTGSGSPVT